MSTDLTAARQKIVAGAARAQALVDQAIAAAQEPAAAHVLTRSFFDQARAAAAAVDALYTVRGPLPRLGGLPVSVKDLFDVAGYPTTAGSKVLRGGPPAGQDCPAVARLRREGASLIGHTNMTEFAFSGIGLNPHYGTPANAGTRKVDPATPRIPGGSTSGGAVSVALGLAYAALGSDTGGSIRIPAALNGLVGFKSTARRVPLDGAVPLSTTLDTVCAMTRSVRDALLLHEVLAERSVSRTGQPLSSYHFALVRNTMLDELDATVSKAFERAIDRLRAAGARIEEIGLPALHDLSGLQANGGFAAAESWAWHRELIGAHEADYDHRVAARIKRGAAISAAEYIDLLAARRQWIARTEAALQGYSAVLSPTVPMVAPPIAQLEHNDDEFFRVNALMLRNPSVVNLLDGCAISLPCHTPDDWPVGLMLWSGAMQDDLLLNAALAVEAALSTLTTPEAKG